MKKLLGILVLALFSLSAVPSSPTPLSLSISPAHAYDWDGISNAKFTYLIMGAKSKPVVCTGWTYPVYNLYREDWPLRRSCRESDFSTISEVWGGRIPLLFIGEYIGFVELYENFDAIPSRPSVRIERTFRVLEGNPH